MSARHRATILGCGASPGVPRIGNDWGACDPDEPKNRRTRCSLLLERFDGDPTPTRILVDTGPDMRAQLLTAGVGAIDAVVYTHAHADHVHGIDDLRVFWQNTKQRVDVYGDNATMTHLERTFGYCFRSPAGSLYPPILTAHPHRAGQADHHRWRRRSADGIAVAPDSRRRRDARAAYRRARVLVRHQRHAARDRDGLRWPGRRGSWTHCATGRTRATSVLTTRSPGANGCGQSGPS